MSDRLSADLGYVYENLVAQMLRANDHELYYYTWPTETSNHLYEVDFLLSNGTKIEPIEVKSSGYKTHRSLDLFCEKFSSRVEQALSDLHQGFTQGWHYNVSACII